MVQVLPGVPGFGTQLAQVLGNAAGDIGQGYFQGRQNRRDRNALEGLDPTNQSPLQTLKTFSGLSPGAQQRLSPIFSQYIKTQGAGQIAQQNKMKEDQDLRVKELEAEDLFKRLRENIEYTGSTWIPFTKSFAADKPHAAWMHPGGNKAVQQREYFNTTARELEKYARQEYTKGTLSAQVFERLMETIPNAELSENQNIGRINAFEDIILKSKRSAREGAKNPEKATEKKRPPLDSIFKTHTFQ